MQNQGSVSTSTPVIRQPLPYAGIALRRDEPRSDPVRSPAEHDTADQDLGETKPEEAFRQADSEPASETESTTEPSRGAPDTATTQSTAGAASTDTAAGPASSEADPQKAKAARDKKTSALEKKLQQGKAPKKGEGVSKKDVKAQQKKAKQAKKKLREADDNAAMMKQFADAPPSVKAAHHDKLGEQSNKLAGEQASKMKEDAPELGAKMSAEKPAESKPLAVPSPKPSGKGPEAKDGDPAPKTDPSPQKNDDSGQPNRGVRAPFDRSSKPPPKSDEERAEEVKKSLDKVETKDPGIKTDFGKRPKVPREKGSDPKKISEKTGKTRESFGSELEKAQQSVVDGPGPEQVKVDGVDESYGIGAVKKPQTKETGTVEGAASFRKRTLDPKVRASFDQSQHQTMKSSLGEASAKAKGAEDDREKGHEKAVEKAQKEEERLNDEADRKKRKAVADGREKIQSKRQSALEKQKKKVDDLDGELEKQRKKDRKSVRSEIEGTEKKVKNKYDKKEEDAQKEVESAEKKAAKKKKDKVEEAEEQSWWDKAVGWVQDQFDKLTSAINAVFDAAREAINTLIDEAAAFAKRVIDAAAKAIKSTIDDFATFAKGLVDDLLADHFPGIAKKLKAGIDAAARGAKTLVDKTAKTLKKGIDAAAKALKKGINAVIDAYQKAINAALSLAKAALTGDWGAIFRKVLEAVLKAAGIEPQAFFAIIEKAKSNFKAIIDDPGSFVSNVLDAVVGGIRKFKNNFLSHLKAGIIGWLTGALGDIEIPEKFNLAGVLSLVRQVLGLTWDYLKEKAADIIGEENVERLEFMFGYLKELITGGWSALWDKIKEDLSGLKQAMLDQLKEFIVVKLVKKAITKLASMFSPVGAIIQAAVTVWNFVQFLMDQLSRLFDLVKTVVNAIDKIVRGVLGPAKEKVEAVLGKLLPVVIDLFAKLIGLTGVADKVQNIIKKIRQKVDEAVDKLIDKAKKLFKGGGSAKDGTDKKAKKTGEEAKADSEKKHAEYIDAAVDQLKKVPSSVDGYDALRKAKKTEADKLERTYDAKLEKPVRMTISFPDSPAKDRKDQGLHYEIRVAPNQTDDEGEIPLSESLPKVWKTGLTDMHEKAQSYVAEKLKEPPDALFSGGSAAKWSKVREWFRTKDQAFAQYLHGRYRISAVNLPTVHEQAKRALEARLAEQDRDAETDRSSSEYTDDLVNRSKPKLHRGRPTAVYADPREAMMQHIFERESPADDIRKGYLHEKNPDLDFVVGGTPMQIHHFATNKHSTWTPMFKDVLREHELETDLDGEWNKELLPHFGSHPNKYHRFVLENMRDAAEAAGPDMQAFIHEFEKRVKSVIRNNPSLLNKNGW